MASKFGSWWQKSRLRSWWQKIRSGLGWLRQKIQQHPYATGIVVLLVLILFIFLAYRFGWNWTGFSGGYSTVTTHRVIHGVSTDTQRPPVKTLWDLLQLLIVPIILAIGGFWLNQIQKDRDQKAEEAQKQREEDAADKRAQTEREIAADNQREAALEAYLNKMSELLLEKKLRESAEGDEVRIIARVRTITVLTQLNARRISYVFAFLRESGLMSTISNDNVVSLSNADLRAVNWSQANLSKANLSEANLNDADLSKADLRGANLRGANLIETDLSSAKLIEADLRGGSRLFHAHLNNAHLSKADLRGANLRGTFNLTQQQLDEVRTCEGAILPEGLTCNRNVNV